MKSAAARDRRVSQTTSAGRCARLARMTALAGSAALAVSAAIARSSAIARSAAIASSASLIGSAASVRSAAIAGSSALAGRVLFLMLPGLLATLAACSPIYVARAGIEEARILSRRRPIEDVIADQRTSARTREKLDLVLQARQYAARVLELDAGDSFTTYSWVDSDTLLMVVTGARKDRFQAYTWWFPIVGHMPYKGFFDFDDAYDEADRLDAAGYDSYVRPSGAFSTLGWFNDPVLNTVLDYSDVGLASTVIHELLHNTIFIPGHVAFNESFANFVGDRGAAEFLCAREGEDSPDCLLARDAWADNLAYGAALTALVRELERLYARADLDFDGKLAAREQEFDRFRAQFRRDVEPKLRTTMFRGFAETELNNATLIGVRLYYDRLDRFDAVYERMGRDLPAAVSAIYGAARTAQDPWAALEALARGDGAR